QRVRSCARLVATRDSLATAPARTKRGLKNKLIARLLRKAGLRRRLWRCPSTSCTRSVWGLVRRTQSRRRASGEPCVRFFKFLYSCPTYSPSPYGGGGSG